MIPMNSVRSLQGSAHGRFQPLHNGHLEYLLAAKQRCDFLWIGLTQYNTRSLEVSRADLHRAVPFNNPLTYFERVEIIAEALPAKGISRDEFAIVPFPIEEPELLRDFLPTRIPVYTTVYDDWNRYKVQLLRQRGYRVAVLYEREDKVYRGTEVRRKILNGCSEWRTLVPPATARAVKRLELQKRLSALAGRDSRQNGSQVDKVCADAP